MTEIASAPADPIAGADHPPLGGVGEPTAPPRRRSGRGILGAAIILVAALALWLGAASVELFWDGLHASRLVIVTLAASASGAALLYLMCRRLRPDDRLRVPFLVLAAIAGGFAALVIPSLIEPAWAHVAVKHLPLLAPVIAGPLEEVTKLVAVGVVGIWVPVRTARTGLFVGGAVGVGYAILENIDYAWSAAAAGRYLPPVDHFLEILPEAVLRTSITPFVHPIWTALTGAALYACWGAGRFRIGRLVVLALAVSVVLHSLWDDVPALLRLWTASLGLPAAAAVAFGWMLLLAGAGLAIWIVAARRANRAAASTIAGGGS